MTGSSERSSANSVADRRVLVGRISGLYGVNGWVKVDSWTEPRLQIFRYQPWRLISPSNEREIEGCRGRVQGKGLVAALPGVGDRDDAAGLVGCEIWVRRSALPALTDKDEYYWADLEGLEVVDGKGISLGQVSHLIATGANDVLVVRGAGRERLIPFVTGDVVTEVNLDEGRITVGWDADF
ncbi:MAG: ribosome maturation factor RimM [Rhodanobacteraceae bacterium]